MVKRGKKSKLFTVVVLSVVVCLGGYFIGIKKFSNDEGDKKRQAVSAQKDSTIASNSSSKENDNKLEEDKIKDEEEDSANSEEDKEHKENNIKENEVKEQKNNNNKKVINVASKKNTSNKINSSTDGMRVKKINNPTKPCTQGIANMKSIRNNLTNSSTPSDAQIIDLLEKTDELYYNMSTYPVMCDLNYEYTFKDNNYQNSYRKLRNEFNSKRSLKSYLTKVCSQKSSEEYTRIYKYYNGNYYLILGDRGASFVWKDTKVVKKTRSGNRIHVQIKGQSYEELTRDVDIIYENGKWVVDNWKF